VRGGFDSHPTSTFLCHRHWRIGLREWLTVTYLGLQPATGLGSILLPAIASTASLRNSLALSIVLIAIEASSPENSSSMRILRRL
jgi:hypothetical protein